MIIYINDNNSNKTAMNRRRRPVLGLADRLVLGVPHVAAPDGLPWGARVLSVPRAESANRESLSAA